MNFKVKLAAVIGALGLCTLSSGARASSTVPPGERVGIDLASPLPPGVYFTDSVDVGNWRDGPKNGNSALDYNLPIVGWSTPWDILGGHIQLYASWPEFSAGYNHLDGAVGGPAAFGHSSYIQSMYNPFVGGMLAWSDFPGFSVSVTGGAYLPITSGDAGNLFNRTTISEMISLAYHTPDGWNFTANLYGGEILDQNSCTSVPAGVIAVFPLGTTCNNNSWFNYDMAVTHFFGKWEFGVVGFGSTDFDVPGRPNPRAFDGLVYPKSQAQFALGGLAGYNFGPVITQLVVSTDVWTQNYNVKETQGLLRVIIPVWHPEPPKTVVAKY